MIVENKKTHRQYEISLNDWNKLRSMNQSKLFRVIDNTDTPLAKERIYIPKEIKEFQENLRITSQLPESKPQKQTKK